MTPCGNEAIRSFRPALSQIKDLLTSTEWDTLAHWHTVNSRAAPPSSYQFRCRASQVRALLKVHAGQVSRRSGSAKQICVASGSRHQLPRHFRLDFCMVAAVSVRHWSGSHLSGLTSSRFAHQFYAGQVHAGQIRALRTVTVNSVSRFQRSRRLQVLADQIKRSCSWQPLPSQRPVRLGSLEQAAFCSCCCGE